MKDHHNYELLGRNLQRYRLEKQLSLSQLAKDAGIAKSNLSRLEQGQANPTLDTIWRLAVRLDVPFSHLVAHLDFPLSEQGVQVKLIDQGTDNPNVDVYLMSCAPHTVRQAAPHSTGCLESILVISGEVTVGPNGEARALSAGQTYQFKADQAHLYQTGEQWANFMVTIVYQAQGAVT